MAAVPGGSPITGPGYASLGEMAENAVITVGDLRIEHDDPNEIVRSMVAAGVTPKNGVPANESQALVAPRALTSG